MLERRISFAKTLTIVSFLALLATSYFLRGEVLALNRIRFSADEARADYEQRRLKETYPDRIRQHAVELKNHEIRLKHYRDMLVLYETNYEEYTRRLEDKFEPPVMPHKPDPPVPPQITEKLSQINAQFRARKFQYFVVTSSLNWAAFLAAAALVGSLLYLLLFDLAGSRVFYLATLILSFVFLIGPSFHSIISAIVGFLEAPGMY